MCRQQRRRPGAGLVGIATLVTAEPRLSLKPILLLFLFLILFLFLLGALLLWRVRG